MAEEAILNNERNPEMPEGNGDSTQYGGNATGNSSSNNRFSNLGKKILGFAKNNKGKLFGFAGLGGISVALTVFGTLLAGPMQIVHASQVIGEVIDTARDINNGRRVARVVQKTSSLAKKAVTAKQNSRVSMLTRIPARNFEKKLAEAGYEIVSSTPSSPYNNIAKNLQWTWIGDGDYGALRLMASETDLPAKEMRKVLGRVIDSMPGNKVYKHIMKRTLNKMYGVAWYQGITRLSSNAAAKISEKSLSTAKKMEAWLESAAESSASKLKKGALKGASSVTGNVGAKITARNALKVSGKGISRIPGIGTIIGGVIDFASRQIFAKMDKEGLLLAAVVVSGIIATAGSNIQNGNVPSEDADGNYVSPWDYLNYFSKQYIYDDFETARVPDDAAGLAGNDPCSDLIVYGEDADNTSYRECISTQLDDNNYDNLPISAEGSSFFSNTPLESEFNPNFAMSADDPEYYRGVPIQLAEIGEDKTGANVINAITSSVLIIGPEDVNDIMEGEFNAEQQIPSDIGGTSMYGARVQQNDLSLSEGAKPLTEQEEIALKRDTQTYLAEQQMNKPLLARLFDVEDYHSGIATLSRDANWDLSDPSFTAQFANAFRTFAAIPNLVAKSFGSYTRAASAASTKAYDYGFKTIAYTPEQVDAEPDYWDAENFLLKVIDEDTGKTNLDNVNQDVLKKCTGATITADDMGIKVEWGESSMYKLDASNKNACASYYSDDETFPSEDADGNPITADGDQAVRVILANYKVLAAFAATSLDGLTDEDLTDIKIDRKEAEPLLIQAMKDMGVEYSSTKTNAVVGNGNIIAAAQDDDGDIIDCEDCVKYVKSVYYRAGLPQPLAGYNDWTDSRYQGCGAGVATDTIANYSYCKGNGFEAHDYGSSYTPVPGDIIVWGPYYDGCGGNFECHVAIYITSNENGQMIVSEGGGGCSFNTHASYERAGKTPKGYIHYTGGS